jgi:hypothetical protein
MAPLNDIIWQEIQLCPSLYCNDQEPLDYDYYKNSYRTWLLESLPHFLNGFTVYEKYLLLHSEKKSINVQKYQQDCFIPVYWWSHAIIALDWFRYAQHVILNRQPKKTFLIYNRAWSGTREYRLRFAELLVQSNLQGSCQASLNPIEPELGIHYNIYQFKNPIWRPQTVLEDYFPTSTAKSHYSADFDINDYENTEIEVVLETLFDDDRWHLTEKSLRSIALGQPFILAGTAGSLDYLRSYGFKTFNDVWDENYDTIKNPEERLCAITDLMTQIVNWGPLTKKRKIAEAQAISEYNRKHLFSAEFFNQVVDELTTNLTTALADIESTKNYQGWLNYYNKYLSDSNLLTRITNQTSVKIVNIPAINNIKALINSKLNPD